MSNKNKDVNKFQSLFLKTFGKSVQDSIQDLFNTNINWVFLDKKSGLWSPQAHFTYKKEFFSISYSTSKVMEVYGEIEESFWTSKEGFLVFTMGKSRFFPVRYRFQVWRKYDPYHFHSQRGLFDAVEDIVNTNNRNKEGTEQKSMLGIKSALEKNFKL